MAEELRFFADPAALRRWYAEHHARAAELWLGFHKVGTGQPSVTYREALDEALCWGWIDGVRRGGKDTWAIRFLPRVRKANWSHVNITRAKALIAQGRMAEAGLAAFAHREEGKAKAAHDALRTARLDAASERALRANPAAWAFWDAQPPGYRKRAAWWVSSAKRPATKAKRLAQLVADCAAERRLRHMTPPAERS